MDEIKSQKEGKTSFGGSPSAMYLEKYLEDAKYPQRHHDRRRVSKVLSSFRRTRTQLVDAFNMGFLDAAVICSVFNSLRDSVRSQINQIQFADEHVKTLTETIVFGELKTILYQCQEISNGKREFIDFMNSNADKIERLKEKSRKYLERHGKNNTLY